MIDTQIDNKTGLNMEINFTHIRHATSIIEIDNKKILLDPMLSDKACLPPVILTKNKHKNPLISLPISIDEIIKNTDYLLLTHLHFDHFDKKAIKRFPKTTSILCSNIDGKKLNKWGFSNLNPFFNTIEIDDFKIKRYSAIHGKGLLRYLMGKGSSYLIEYNRFKIFITGDCILTDSLKKVLIETKPDIIIVNAGKAEFKFGKPITMSIIDIQQISGILKNSKIFVVHLDALNHCSETREYCKKMVENFRNVYIPVEGEKIRINNVA